MDKTLEEIARTAIHFSLTEQPPETYIEKQFETHKKYGATFWEACLLISDNHPFPTRADHLKDRIKNYCAIRLQETKHFDEIQKQSKQKDADIVELTRANLKLQNEYLPHAINQSKQRTTTFVIGGILGIVASLLPILADRYWTKKEEPTQLQTSSRETVCDTTKIYKTSCVLDSGQTLRKTDKVKTLDSIKNN